MMLLRSRLFPVFALALALVCAPALAGSPEDPFPDEMMEEDFSPAPVQPSVPDATAQPAPEEWRTRMDAPVAKQDIAPLPEVSKGLLTAKTGGFDRTLWQGIRRNEAADLLPRVPAAVTTPVTLGLARRLLLTEAVPPEGFSATEFLTLRTRTLEQMGLSAEAAGLGGSPPSSTPPADENGAWALVEESLKQGDLDTVCAPKFREQTRPYTDRKWARLLVLCQISQTDLTAAALGLSLQRESGATNDPLFLDLAESIVSGTPPPALSGSETLSPLHLALMEAGRIAIPAAALETFPPGRLARLATDTSTPPLLRFQAALKLAPQGLADTDTLLKSARAVSFRPGELADATALASERDRAEALALLYQAAKARRGKPMERAGLAQAMVALLQPQELVSPAADLVLDILDTVGPTDSRAEMAAGFARLYYGRGLAAKAKPWHALALNHATAHPETTDTVALLWPLALASGASSAEVPGAEAAFNDLTARTASAENRIRMADLQLLVQALTEVPAPPVADTPSADGVQYRMRSLSPAVNTELATAARAGQTGKTVLLSLTTLGPDGPQKASVPTTAQAIRALRQVGLADDARALARETLVLRTGS
ncbi:MAG: hypothetical protein M3O22_03785 [Pseudomonadota bacterium]|nr:hypothetical protein [Pseudomonadota bacterium]